MSNKEIPKCSVDKEVFLRMLELKKCSIRKLGSEYDIIERTEKTIRRCLNERKMPVDLLERIAQYLNIDPDLLSGKLHKQAELFTDPYLKKYILSLLTPENHPYPLGAKSMKDYPEFFETMLNLNNISLIDFKKLEIEKRIYFHQEVNYAILKVIANYFEKDSRGNDIKEILSYQESMLFDFDPFSYYASLEGIKESDIKTS